MLTANSQTNSKCVRSWLVLDIDPGAMLWRPHWHWPITIMFKTRLLVWPHKPDTTPPPGSLHRAAVNIEHAQIHSHAHTHANYCCWRLTISFPHPFDINCGKCGRPPQRGLPARFSINTDRSTGNDQTHSIHCSLKCRCS